MSALLWIDTGADRALDLGDPFRLYQSFAEMDHAALDRGHAEFPELFGVIEATELQDDADPAWLAKVKAQAADFAGRYGARLGAGPRAVLAALAPAETPEMPAMNHADARLFAELSRFCQSGDNAGKPGPCPESVAEHVRPHLKGTARAAMTAPGELGRLHRAVSKNVKGLTPAHVNAALAHLARGESGGSAAPVPAPAAKPASKPAASAPAASPSTFRPEEHHAALLDAVKAHGGQYNLADLVHVRKALADRGLNREQQDAVIKHARKAGTVTGSAYEGRQGVSPEQKEAAIREGSGLVTDHPIGMLSIRNQQHAEDVRLHAELTRFCQEGPNKGKPGPCPGGKKGGAATKAPAAKKPVPKPKAARPAPAPKPEKKPAPTVDEAHARIKELTGSPAGFTPQQVHGVVDDLSRMPVADLRKLRDKLGVKATDRGKAQLAARVAVLALAGQLPAPQPAGSPAKATPKPKTPPMKKEPPAPAPVPPEVREHGAALKAAIEKTVTDPAAGVRAAGEVGATLGHLPPEHLAAVAREAGIDTRGLKSKPKLLGAIRDKLLEANHARESIQV
jgi:hypothetical protein